MATGTQPGGLASPAERLHARGARMVGGIRARPLAAHLLLMGTVAFSGGVHAGLVPAHLDDPAALPLSFGLAAALLACIALALGLRPGSVWPPRAAAVVFAGQIAAYLVFTDDLLDPIGVTTKLVEASGLLVALSMRPVPALAEQRRALAPVYVLLIVFVVLVALQASGQHAH